MVSLLLQGADAIHIQLLYYADTATISTFYQTFISPPIIARNSMFDTTPCLAQ